jgi:S1-C subfamily serine protease
LRQSDTNDFTLQYNLLFFISHLPQTEMPSLLEDVHEKSQHLFDDAGVVLVCTKNGSWGSGIIISWSEGLVLTCSHVVKTDRKGLFLHCVA